LTGEKPQGRKADGGKKMGVRKEKRKGIHTHPRRKGVECGRPEKRRRGREDKLAVAFYEGKKGKGRRIIFFISERERRDVKAFDEERGERLSYVFILCGEKKEGEE